MRIFSHNLRRDIARERAMIFGGAPVEIDFQKAHATQRNDQTNSKQTTNKIAQRCVN
jgi:hypothetical protein